jgi:hypothetical protein
MPSREVTCPHCFREVFVNPDDRCPACRGNVNEGDPELADLTAVEFVDGELLPPVCILCGEESQFLVEIGEKHDLSTDDGPGFVAQLIGALNRVLFPTKPPSYFKEYAISVKLPTCERHQSSPLLNAVDIDYRRYRMSFPAHPEFIRRWKQADSET